MNSLALHIATCAQTTAELVDLLQREDGVLEQIEEKMRLRSVQINDLKTAADNLKKKDPQEFRQAMAELLKLDEEMRNLLNQRMAAVTDALHMAEHEEKAGRSYIGGSPTQRFITGRLEG